LVGSWFLFSLGKEKDFETRRRTDRSKSGNKKEKNKILVLPHTTHEIFHSLTGKINVEWNEWEKEKKKSKDTLPNRPQKGVFARVGNTF